MINFLLSVAPADVPAEEVIDTAKQTWFASVKGLDDVLMILLNVGICIIVTLLVAFIYRKLWKKWEKRHAPKIHHRFIYNIFLIVIYFVGIIVALGRIPGVSNLMTPLIQSSGFLALGLGLAAQESLGNIINGMVISVAKPFEVGDRVHLVNSKITGYVEDITLRHTVMRTFVNSRIIIPNSVINKELIENSNYQEGKASAFIDVTVTYDSDMTKAMEIMEAAVGGHEHYVDSRSDFDKANEVPLVKVFLRDLGINGVMLRASMWTFSTDNNFEACSDVRKEIKKEFDKAKILLAQIPARPENYQSIAEEQQEA